MSENSATGRLEAVYSLLAVAASWFPLTVALVTTVSWVFWLVMGIRLKHT